MRTSRSNSQVVAIYAAILGSIYLIIGAAEFITGLHDLLQLSATESFLGLPIDFFGGFSAFVIGATYLGGTLLWKEKVESLGFLLIATILSAVFGLLYLLIACADGFGILLGTWEGGEWTWEWLTSGTAGTGILRPEIWLAIASIPMGYFVIKTTRREKVE